MSKRYVSWSYSRWNDFDTCPRMFHHKYILKDVPEPDGEALDYGKEVHKALELRVKRGRELPKKLQHMEPLVAALLAKYPFSDAELELAVDRRWNPCDWFGKAVMARAILDLVLWDDEPRAARQALIIDWKTGKVKTDLDQLELSAAILQSHFPSLEKIYVGLVFTEFRQVVPRDLSVHYDETLLQDIREEWSERADDIQRAAQAGKWQPRRGPLCRFCPCTPEQCEFKER